MKPHYLFSLIFAFLISTCQIATAEEKITVGIIPVNDRSGLSSGEINEIEDAITDAFMKAKHFAVVDRANIKALDNEKRLQKSEDFIDGKTIEQGKSLGAQYLITSKVSNYKNDGSVCKFSLSLTVIDVSTGQIVNSDIIDVKGGGHGKKIAGAVGGAVLGRVTGVGYGYGAAVGSSVGSRDNAMKKALDDISDEIDVFVEKYFPLQFSIVEIQKKDANGGAVKILISGGSAFGLKKGTKLKAVQLKDVEVDGKKMTRKIELGNLTVTNVEDENFSVCLVNTVENSIAAKFESKEKIKVITTPNE